MCLLNSFTLLRSLPSPVPLQFAPHITKMALIEIFSYNYKP